MKAYDHSPSSDGRLTSLPKPKVSNSVADKYKANASGNGGAPSFGAKPVFGHQSAESKKDKVVGGLSRNFGAENGKTPAQIWAEKRGKYKTVANDDDNDGAKSTQGDNEVEEHHASDLAKKFEQQAKIAQEEEEEEKTTPSLPTRNLPPPVRQAAPEPEEEEDEEDEEEENQLPYLLETCHLHLSDKSNLNLNQRKKKREEEEEKEEPAAAPAAAPAPGLPARNLPPAPQAEEPKKDSVTATAEYEYEKDEDNEIGFDEGDLIVEIEFVDEDWWKGKHSKTGEVGLFPASYVSLNENQLKRKMHQLLHLCQLEKNQKLH